MGIFDFFKKQQKETEPEVEETVTNKQQLSTIVNNQQLEEESYSKRDLHYARRIGQLEEMSEDVSKIKDRLTALDVKFDLRVPEKVLTEKKFEEEVLESKDIIEEIEAIRKGLSELERAITNKQQLSTIGSIRESAERIEIDLREAEIKKNMKGERLATDELGKKLGLSRSRTNQLLLEMEKKGMVSRVKYGKKYLWSVT